MNDEITKEDKYAYDDFCADTSREDYINSEVNAINNND